MDIRFLESLIAVVDKGSIAEAARLQAITPAAVSQRIQSLEQDLDVLLLNRSAHKAKPTEACLNILPRARKMVFHGHALSSDIDNTGLSGIFRIGAISTALTSLVPKALKQLSQYAPKAKLQIKPGTSADLYNALKNRQIDAAIIVKPPFPIPKILTYKKLNSEPLTLISHRPITCSINEELASQAYIQYDPISWGGRLAARYMNDNNIVKDPLCELDALETISILVSQGLGVSLVPNWTNFSSLQGSNLFNKTINNEVYNRELVLIYPYYPNRPKLIEKFVSLVGQ